MNEGRITYRFVRNEPPDAADPAAMPSAGKPPAPEQGTVIPLFREDVDGYRLDAPERSALKEEADRIERLILQGAAAAGNPVRREGEFASDSPHDEDGAGGTGEEAEVPKDRVVYRRVHQRGKKDWLTLLMSGLGAILTGVLLGSFVFGFFRGDPAPAVDPSMGSANGGEMAAPGFSQPASQAGDAPSAILPQADEPGPDAGSVDGKPVRLPELAYYVVQNGVFSSREGADAAAEVLRDKGYAGAVEEGEKLAVYAGVANDRDDALLIARQLEAEGLDIFIKPVELPALDVPAGVLPDADFLAAYLTESRELMDLVMDLSLRHLNEASPGALSDGERQDLREAHWRWTERASGLTELADTEAKGAMEAINRSVASAMAAMEQYAKHPSSSFLWQAQTGLLHHLIAQKKVLDILAEIAPQGSKPATAGYPV